MHILGCLGLILGCGSIGLWLAGRARRRPGELRACLTALALLDTEIYWGATPLPEAFESLRMRMEKPWAGFFAEIQEHIEKGEAAWPAWKKTVANQNSNFCLKKEDWLVILDVGKGLGRSDRQEQHKQLDLVQKQLIVLRDQAAAWAEKQAKMMSYLGFLFGFAVVILLV